MLMLTVLYFRHTTILVRYVSVIMGMFIRKIGVFLMINIVRVSTVITQGPIT